MSEPADAEALARIWIERWNEGAPDLIPLAEHFTHTSPFGRVEGSRTYLEWVKPLAEQNVTHLKVLRVLSSPNEATIRTHSCTPNCASAGARTRVCTADFQLKIPRAQMCKRVFRFRSASADDFQVDIFCTLGHKHSRVAMI